MIVRPLDAASRRDRRRWINFPFELYAGCPQWVPQLHMDAAEQINRAKNPFFEHSDAEFFMAIDDDGRTLGRVCVMEHRRLNAHKGWRAAQFYLFEVVEDFAVAEALFAAAADWARARGLDEIIGPKGFLQGDGMGVLIEGFEHTAALGQLYNYPYYGPFLERLGFEKITDYVSCTIPVTLQLPAKIHKIADRVRERRNFEIVAPSTWRDPWSHKNELLAMYQSAFIDNWEYVPVTDREADALGRRLLTIGDKKLSRVLYRDGEMAGFIFVFPNVAEALRATKGRLFPFGFIRLLWARARTDQLDINGAGIIEKHQGAGANALLYSELFKVVTSKPQFRHAEAVQIDEKNARMIADLETLGIKVYKRHRVYRKPL